MKRSNAEIVQEYGPFADIAHVAGVSHDGQHIWFAAGETLKAVDPAGGADSGLAWHEGTLWVGEYRARRIHQIDAQTGAILRSLESNRFVTGVTWVDGELWHGTWEGDSSDLRQLDPATGAVLEVVDLPAGVFVSGLESDGAERFYCGGATTCKIRAVRRPRRATRHEKAT